MIGGVKGNLHTRDFQIIDEDIAYIIPVKAMPLTVLDLLYNDASIAKNILNNFKPAMTKEEYLNFMESIDKVELFEG